MNSLDSIPDEVLRLVIEFISWEDVMQLSVVAKASRIATVCSSNELWRDKYNGIRATIDIDSIKSKLGHDADTITNYREALLDIRREYVSYAQHMGSTGRSIAKAVLKNSRLSDDIRHAYVGEKLLRCLFERVADEVALEKKFGLDLKLKSQVLKAIIVGDSNVGATSFLLTLPGREIVDGYIPSVVDNFIQKETFCGIECQIEFCDTSGQEDHYHTALRLNAYKQADIILLSFSCCQEYSFRSLSNRWIPEISFRNNSAAILLVGTKCDLRDSGNERDKTTISYEQAVEKAKEFGCVGYIETSSQIGTGMNKILPTMLRGYVIHQLINQKKSNCNIA